MSNSIEINAVSKLYGSQRALDKVSMNVQEGEICGLLGPNGAGKSTLMKIITCFIPPDEGSVNVYGHNIAEDPMSVRKRVGYLPEHNPLYYEMYVHEFLLFIAGLHKIPGNRKERVKEMIEITGLGVEQHKKIGALSKGFRQRVGLAQAMIHDPEVLILDEPTSGLDPNQIVEIRSLIKTLGEKKTVLFSTHIMQEVEALCNRVVIIDKGRIIADKPIDQLPELAAGSDILHVEFDKPVNVKDLKRISGVNDVVSSTERIFQIETKPEIDVRSSVFKFAVNNDVEVLSMTKTKRSLEEVFQLLTREK